jgi:chromosome segregation ATPase
MGSKLKGSKMKKDELIKSLQPALEGFADSLLKSYKPLLEWETELSKEETELQREKDRVANRKRDIEVELANGNKSIQELKTQFVDRMNELGNESSSYRKKQTELEKVKNETDSLYEATKSDQKKTAEELKKQEKITQEHQRKLDYLKTDFDKLAKDKADLVEKQNQTTAKAKENIRQEEILAGAKRALEERVLDIALKEKTIRIELKKLELNG